MSPNELRELFAIALLADGASPSAELAEAFVEKLRGFFEANPNCDLE